MTRIPSLLGNDYDSPASLPDGTDVYKPKRDIALAELRRAEAAGEADIVELMHWELGLIDLVLAPGDGVSPYGGGDYKPYAEFHHLTPETAAYARERAFETRDVILKLQYLEYALLQMEPQGRPWIDLQREILGTYREYADGCRASASSDGEGFAGLHVERALVAVGRLLRRPGVLRAGEAAAWAEWLLTLAEDSRGFPAGEGNEAEQQRHRWVADYLGHLADLPASSVDSILRDRALVLLDEAATYHRATPLNDQFEHHVAEVDANLRKYWGEKGTHERLIRRKFDATVRRAEFHRQTGNGLITSSFFREARRIVEEHRQYFTDDDVARLQLAERAALEHAVEAREFSQIHVPMKIPDELMDYTRETPEATMEALLEQVTHSVPDRTKIHREVKEANVQAPLQSVLSRTVIGDGKVVGESRGEEDNEVLDVEERALFLTNLLGAAVTTTIIRAAAKVGLTADVLVEPLAPLNLDEGTTSMIRHACDRFIHEDFVSAMHVIVPHIEDVLRQHLKSLGVDTTEFRRDVGDGTSRTDDATLGALMRKSLRDGRTVQEYLGPDLWAHLDSTLNSQTGLNLRNEFAHGLARPQHCSPQNAGIALSLLYLLANVAEQHADRSIPTS